MRISLSSGLSITGGGRGKAQAITAIVFPSIGAITAGETIASALSANYDQASNYRSMGRAGGVGIQAFTPAITVNGVSAAASATPAAGETVAFSFTITDDQGNTRPFTASTVVQAVPLAAPTAANALADQSFVEGAAITPLDVSTDFTGQELTFALSPSSAALPAGLSLSSAGVITGTPTTPAAQANIIIRATNSAGSVDSAFGITITEAVAPPEPTGDIVFGEFTLSGAGATAISADDGTYGQFTVSVGQITPNTSPLTVGTTTVGATSVEVVANEYTIINEPQLQAALNHAHPAGGRTIRFRTGTNVMAGTDVGGFNNAETGATPFTSRMIITGEQGAIVKPSLYLSNIANITIENLHFSDPDAERTAYIVGGSPAIIGLRRNTFDVIIQDNEISGKYYDPTGFWANAEEVQVATFADLPETGIFRTHFYVVLDEGTFGNIYYWNPNTLSYDLHMPNPEGGFGLYFNSDVGIRTIGGDARCGNIIVRRNHIHDVQTATTLTIGRGGGLVVEDNLVNNIYADCLKFAVAGGSEHLAQILLDGATHQRNVLFNFLGNPANPGNPHIDMIQFISAGLPDNLQEFRNVIWRQNVAFESSTTQGRGGQGITSFNDSSRRIIFKDPICVGNIMALSGNHHVSIQADGGIFAHNLLVQGVLGWGYFPNNPPRFNVETPGEAPIFFRNITEGPTFNGTHDVRDDLIIGLAGNIIPFEDIFAGLNDQSTYDAFMAAFFPKENGPADGNVGPFDYGTFGQPLTATGWTFDADKEIPPAPPPPVESDIEEIASGGVEANTITITTPTAGDMIMLVAGKSSGGTMTDPAGWTLVRKQMDGINDRVNVYSRVSDGSTLNPVVTGANSLGYAIYRAPNGITIGASDGRAANSASAEMPGLTLGSGGTERWIFGAFNHRNGAPADIFATLTMKQRYNNGAATRWMQILDSNEPRETWAGETVSVVSALWETVAVELIANAPA